MALIINRNMPAAIAARNLGTIYGSLDKSIERLSSGLRINRAADDAAGLAVREMMRAEVAAALQGIRNAADAVSLIQTADGALGVIDAKLIRMKELAEQAATGTYTTAQRLLINSEFQAMAAEIDRIANATTFNGIKLLDGSMAANGGIMIHFGPNNNAAEDYYYINTADVRAHSTAGLGIGFDSINDIWGTGGSTTTGLNGCCGGAFASSAAVVVTTDWRDGFGYYYNWDDSSDMAEDNGELMSTFENSKKYLAGFYSGSADMTIAELTRAVNAGTQSRAVVRFDESMLPLGTGNYAAFCLGTDEMYVIGTQAAAIADIGTRTVVGTLGGQSDTAAQALNLATVINNTANSNYWAMRDGSEVIIFRKDGGDNNNEEIGFRTNVTAHEDNVTFFNVANGNSAHSGAKLSLGGEDWATMALVPAGGDALNVRLDGRDAGDGYDIQIASATATALMPPAAAGFAVINDLYMTQVQDAEDGRGTLRTQEAAQTALGPINQAIMTKDEIRASLGATQNRLEATIEYLTVQAENLQAAESRISDVDVALEMTEFTRQNVLAQAAAAMLAQANSMATLALTLLA
jgi:flagellin